MEIFQKSHRQDYGHSSAGVPEERRKLPSTWRATTPPWRTLYIPATMNHSKYTMQSHSNLLGPVSRKNMLSFFIIFLMLLLESGRSERSVIDTYCVVNCKQKGVDVVKEGYIFLKKRRRRMKKFWYCNICLKNFSIDTYLHMYIK